MKFIVTIGLLFTVLVLCPARLQAQDVIRHPDASEVLGQKWAWAEEQAGQHDFQRGYWIGYSIERLMGEQSYIGSWSSRKRRMTLHELLYGEKAEFEPGRGRAYYRDGEPDRKVLKEVALLFEFRQGTSEPHNVRVTNLAGHVDLERHPLIWLGAAEDDESLDLVQQQYDRARSEDAREELVMAVAIHDETERVVAMLEDILTGNDGTDVRESAAFWLGQQDDSRALDLLIRTARDDRSEDVREQAVFGISQMDLAAATEALIDLARNARGEVRKNAIFWLGQKASERAVEALGEMVEEDADTEVQKQAVFALSQQSDDRGVPMLIEIAKTHPKAAVRKQAIFWLGQSNDPRALEAIIELARG
ncbi:MAG: HEAT repeat domain-containing protein [Rhodothermales bacterium]